MQQNVLHQQHLGFLSNQAYKTSQNQTRQKQNRCRCVLKCAASVLLQGTLKQHGHCQCRQDCHTPTWTFLKAIKAHTHGDFKTTLTVLVIKADIQHCWAKNTKGWRCWGWNDTRGRGTLRKTKPSHFKWLCLLCFRAEPLLDFGDQHLFNSYSRLVYINSRVTESEWEKTSVLSSFTVIMSLCGHIFLLLQFEWENNQCYLPSQW